MVVFLCLFIIRAYGSVMDDHPTLFHQRAPMHDDVAMVYDHDKNKEPFSVLLDYRMWPAVNNVYHKVGRAQQKRTVAVECRPISLQKGMVTVSDCEQQRVLNITMDFSQNTLDLLHTKISYQNGSTSVDMLMSSYALAVIPCREENAQCGYGCVDVCMADGMKAWRPQMPRADFSKRCCFAGLINGDSNHIEVTQYLFCSCDVERGYFFRITVEYEDLAQIKIAWGQERYGGRQFYHDKAEALTEYDQTIDFSSVKPLLWR